MHSLPPPQTTDLRNATRRGTPLPFIREGTAFLIEDALSPQHCRALQAQASALGFAATGHDYPPSYRDNDRQVWDDGDFASRLFAELSSLLPVEITAADGSAWSLCGLNSRFRFCRYRGGQGFRIHQDGAHEPAADRRSILTLQVYLDDDPARVGGQTRFYATRQGGLLGGVTPRIGRAIVFEHRLWHDGEPVTQGEKHVLRTDVMYQRTRSSATSPACSKAAEPPARPARLLRGHQGYVFALAALPGGELASGSRDRTIRITQPATGEVRACIRGHRGSISSLCLLAAPPDGAARNLLSGGRDHALRISDIGTGESAALAVLPGAVLALADCGPDHVAVGCGDGGIWLFARPPLLAADAVPRWQQASGPLNPTACLMGRGTWVWALLPLPGGRLLAGGEDGCLQLWDLASRALLSECALGHGAVHALSAIAFDPSRAESADFSFAAGCADGYVVWITGADGGTRLEPRAAHPAHRGEVYALCSPAAGGLLSAGEDGRIAHSQIVAGTLQPARPPELGTHPNFIRCLTPLPDGKIASAGYDGDIAVWDPLPT